MKFSTFILVIIAVIAFGWITMHVIIPAAIFLIKFLIGLAVAAIFGAGVWVGYFITNRNNKRSL